MLRHLDTNDPRYPQLAGEILRRHGANEAEANIRSAVRDLLIATNLAKSDEIVEETSPALGSRKAVDLTALDTFIEFKRRVGTTGGGPDPKNVRQIDDYLALSADEGRVRMGVLTDGKCWLLRWPGAREPRLSKPYWFILEDEDGWLPLYEWLRDDALVALENVTPDEEAIVRHFGPLSPSYEREIDALRSLFAQNAHKETVKVKRQLWHDLLRSALGEITQEPEGLDDLFVRHTYLSAVIGMVVQASFGLDIRRIADDSAALLRGTHLREVTGLQGVLDSDFFVWPAETGGGALVHTLARRVARFDWVDAPANIAAVLYEAVIPPEERRQLGEYYTPSWLARAMVAELIDSPLEQKVLDPACGSGTFLAEAVDHFISAAKTARWEPSKTLDRLRVSVTGIDVHPVAAHLARSAWVLAAKEVIERVMEGGNRTTLSVPVYLGDSLQLRFRTGDLFADTDVTIDVKDDSNTQLVFPVSVVDRSDDFDTLMTRVAAAIENHQDPTLALDDTGITNLRERGDARADDRQTLQASRRGEKPHLGLLHPQSGQTSSPRPTRGQGRRHRRESSLDQLQPDSRHPSRGIAAPQQECLRDLDRRTLRTPTGRRRTVLRALL